MFKPITFYIFNKDNKELLVICPSLHGCCDILPTPSWHKHWERAKGSGETLRKWFALFLVGHGYFLSISRYSGILYFKIPNPKGHNSESECFCWGRSLIGGTPGLGFAPVDSVISIARMIWTALAITSTVNTGNFARIIYMGLLTSRLDHWMLF